MPLKKIIRKGAKKVVRKQLVTKATRKKSTKTAEESRVDRRTPAQIKKERERILKWNKRFEKGMAARLKGKKWDKEDDAVYKEAQAIIAERTKNMAGPQERKLRAQKAKLKATKPTTVEGKAKKKAKLKEINSKIFKITGRFEGMKNTYGEARNMRPYASRKTREKYGSLK